MSEKDRNSGIPGSRPDTLAAFSRPSPCLPLSKGHLRGLRAQARPGWKESCRGGHPDSGRRGVSQDPYNFPGSPDCPQPHHTPNFPLALPAKPHHWVSREVLLDTSTQRTCLQWGTPPFPHRSSSQGPHLLLKPHWPSPHCPTIPSPGGLLPRALLVRTQPPLWLASGPCLWRCLRGPWPGGSLLRTSPSRCAASSCHLRLSRFPPTPDASLI